MTGFDVVFMLVFAGIALTLGLIAEANKNRDEAPTTKYQPEDDRESYRHSQRALKEILDVLPEHSIHYPVISPLVSEANGLVSQGNFAKARRKVEKARTHLLDNIETLAFIRPLNKVYLAPDVPKEFDIEIAVESMSLYEDRPDYAVNPFKKTCTCDWIENLDSSDLNLNDVRRICRHQVDALAREGFNFDTADEIAAQILNSPFRTESYTIIREKDLKFILGFDHNYEWIQVLLLEPKMKDNEFSFNLRERRWAYGESPRGCATKVKAAIRKTFDFRNAQ